MPAPAAADPGPAASAAEARVTPMMAQYIEIKAAHPDCLLFYRMGDFYELFFADAEIASRVLGIVLTRRGKHLGEDIPMAGVPIERGEDALHRLIAAGHRVAVCEQSEDPAEARRRGPKAVVRRDVVRLVTPGTLTEDRLLDPLRPNLLVAIARRRGSDRRWAYGIAALDISTGLFTTLAAEEGRLAAELARLDPAELLLPDEIHDDPALAGLRDALRGSVTTVPRDGLDPSSAERRLREFYGVATLDSFGAFTRPEIAAAGAALAYVERTQYGARPSLSRPRREEAGTTLLVDAPTRASLELVRTLSGSREGSLLAAIDRTVTAAGGRLLAGRLAGPSTDPAVIGERQRALAVFLADADLRAQIRAELKAAPDISRALSRLTLGRGGPRDLACLRDGMVAALGVARRLGGAAPLPTELSASMGALDALDPAFLARLRDLLEDSPPLSRRDGGFVRAGADPALDELRALGRDSRAVVAALQGRYAAETACRTLRIKHNNLLGYFVEVPASVGEAFTTPPLRETFVHRQTMAGAMRFTTAELAELQGRIDTAGERALALESVHFDALAAAATAAAPALAAASEALAVVDVASSLAELASDEDWACPKVEEGLAFAVEGCRHPVVEQALRREGRPFVANDCDLSDGRLLLVTGPNMGGKSTYLRQAALLVILAQMGAYVPARQARIGIVDRLFSRVGAADDLARGRSTFMVEMVETAAILNGATSRSLVILDEIGRGTATFDGLSIAWATIEHLHDRIGCRALFATHYHELTGLAERRPRIANATLRVSEWEGDLVFLHEVVPGAADRSYGLQVARLAGLPSPVVRRARSVLTELERADRERPRAALVDELPLFAAAAQPEPSRSPAADPLRTALAGLDPDELSPREALEALYRLKLAADG